MKIFKKSEKSFVGAITGISGTYAGAVFRIDLGENITFGRDPKTSQIVVDENCGLVSRTHCTVAGSTKFKGYTLIDHSTNGTFVNGERVPFGVLVSVPKGSLIYLGDTENTFKLN